MLLSAHTVCSKRNLKNSVVSSTTDGKPTHNEIKCLAHSQGGNLGLNSILNTNLTDPYF